LQYIQILNHYFVHLKLVYCYMSIIPLFRKNNWGIENDLDWVVYTLGLYLAVTEKSKLIVTYKTKFYLFPCKSPEGSNSELVGQLHKTSDSCVVHLPIPALNPRPQESCSSTSHICIPSNGKKHTPFLLKNRKTALLGYNSHTLPFTQLKCTIRWLLV